MGTQVGVRAEQQAGAEALSAMQGRALASSEDRPAWLAARALRVTATEAAKIADGSQAARARLLQDKLHPEQVRDLSGDRYVARGNARERVIADWLAATVPGLQHNAVLFGAAEQPLHAATPDVYGVTQRPLEDLPVGTFLVGDIKTSKHDLDPAVPNGYFWSTTYMDQLQWQMHVAGARAAVFCWEQHDDDWPDPQPLDLEPRLVVVHYSAERVTRMIAQADLLLAELEHERAQQDGGAPVPLQVRETLLQADELGMSVLDGRRAEAEAKARREANWQRLQTLLEQVPSFSRTGVSRVTWTNEDVTERVPDPDAALAAHVDGMDEDVTGADLKADLDRATAAWAEHQARFTKDRIVTVRKLTVTDPSKKAAARG